jgi:hypothetical protein
MAKRSMSYQPLLPLGGQQRSFRNAPSGLGAAFILSLLLLSVAILGSMALAFHRQVEELQGEIHSPHLCQPSHDNPSTPDLHLSWLDPILKWIRKEGVTHLLHSRAKDELQAISVKAFEEIDRFPVEVAEPLRMLYNQIFQAFTAYAAHMLVDAGQNHPRLVVSGISGYDVILAVLPEAAPVEVILAP